uniref:Pentacotripeptide-repeat region of PRORP domain-containing protein n=1 Tax=Chromera velia CCMP2878 TaxID=1169474 RepID=A0A0G4IES3_9ALVE|eukprot:Cvel_13800.t1-p1 / transcript=Cvel_13800.t1 / gene=Cvel_13800 / organism=Chromera_velia_CCMP2878 / gene_product=hypothetical protein / transcript_product=hypothetical protein / location=Cvel_scaffold957:12120-14531(-) / protein_length=804 / sequence_SO=supercontig / SO=protein_coding / is_pseudo=false
MSRSRRSVRVAWSLSAGGRKAAVMQHSGINETAKATRPHAGRRGNRQGYQPDEATIPLSVSLARDILALRREDEGPERVLEIFERIDRALSKKKARAPFVDSVGLVFHAILTVLARRKEDAESGLVSSPVDLDLGFRVLAAFETAANLKADGAAPEAVMFARRAVTEGWLRFLRTAAYSKENDIQRVVSEAVNAVQRLSDAREPAETGGDREEDVVTNEGGVRGGARGLVDLQGSRKKSVCGSTFSKLLAILVPSGDWRRAAGQLSEMSRLDIPIQSHHIAMVLDCSLRNPSGMKTKISAERWRIWDWVEFHGIPKGPELYVQMLSDCRCRLGGADVKTGKRLWEEYLTMTRQKERQVAPSVASMFFKMLAASDFERNYETEYHRSRDPARGKEECRSAVEVFWELEKEGQMCGGNLGGDPSVYRSLMSVFAHCRGQAVRAEAADLAWTLYCHLRTQRQQTVRERGSAEGSSRGEDFLEGPLLPLDGGFYFFLLDTLLEADRTELVSEVKADMRERGVALTSDHFYVLIRNLWRYNETDGGEGVWERLEKLEEEMETSGVGRDVRILEALIDLNTKENRWEESLRLFKELQGETGGSVEEAAVYEKMLESCSFAASKQEKQGGAAGDGGRSWALAVKLFLEMKRKGLRIDHQKMYLLAESVAPSQGAKEKDLYKKLKKAEFPRDGSVGAQQMTDEGQQVASVPLGAAEPMTIKPGMKTFWDRAGAMPPGVEEVIKEMQHREERRKLRNLTEKQPKKRKRRKEREAQRSSPSEEEGLQWGQKDPGNGHNRRHDESQQQDWKEVPR